MEQFENTIVSLTTSNFRLNIFLLFTYGLFYLNSDFARGKIQFNLFSINMLLTAIKMRFSEMNKKKFFCENTFW